MQLLMDYQKILTVIPHRYPFLFVDGILEYQDASYAKGFKNISSNEPYLYGQLQGKPRLPESIITECMAQVGVVGILSAPESRGKIMLFAAIENLRFYREVYPGDRLISEVKRIYMKGNIGKMKAIAKIKNEMVAEGEFSYAIVEPASELR